MSTILPAINGSNDYSASVIAPKEAAQRQAAQDLAAGFFFQMLKSAKLGDALGATEGIGYSLSDGAIQSLAEDMAARSRPLVDNLYSALSKDTPGQEA